MSWQRRSAKPESGVRLLGRTLLWFFLAWGAAGWAGPASGEPAAGAAPAEAHKEPAAADRAVTLEVIEARRRQAQEQPNLDAETRKRIADYYAQAKEALSRAAESARKAASFKQDTDRVQQRVRETQQQIEELRGKTPTLPEVGTLPELEQELTKRERLLADLKQAQAQAEAEPANRGNRRKEARALLLSAAQRLAEIDKQLEVPSPPDEPAMLALARRSELLARRLAIAQEIPALQNELAKYDAEDAVDLVRLCRDLRIQEVSFAERQCKLVDSKVRLMRAQAAREAVRQAAEESIQAQPLLKGYAERNKELAEQAQALTQLISRAERDRQKKRALLEDVQRQYEQTKSRVESVGLTGSVGAMLRKQRISLSEIRRRSQESGPRQMTPEEARFALFELDDERTELAKPESIVQRILQSAPEEMTGYERSVLEHAAHNVLERKREYLDTLIRHHNTYFDVLIELETTEQKLAQVTKEFINYIDERVLWIRSGTSLASGIPVSETDRWILSPAQWAGVGAALGDDMCQNPHCVLGPLFGLGLLAAFRRRFKRRMREAGELAQRGGCTEFGLTLRTAAQAAANAALWPAAALYVSWRLEAARPGAEFARAVAYALRLSAAAVLPFEVLRQICGPSGLAVSHFGWRPSAASLLETNLRGMLAVGAPVVFVTAALHAIRPEKGFDAVERLCFLAGAAIAAFFLGRILRPSRGVLQEYLACHRESWIGRLRYAWYWLAVAYPLTLAALAFFGFYYTAQQLTWRLFLTVCLVLALLILRSFLLRWLLLRRRCLSIQQARGRRAAALAAQLPRGGENRKPAGLVPPEETADLARLSGQTQRLVSAGATAACLIGVWLIWVDVFPALGFLDRWPLWSTVVQVQETITDPAGGTQTVTRDAIENVTPSDLLLALLIACITFVAFRNLPGVMEMWGLQRLPLDASVRYAITSLASYLIIVVGSVVACGTIGLRWSQVQWLATALTFGLAFGLQEMFANFVSGLIILFERPIRVGDVVTVGDVTGVVSRVRIRATTITDGDRRDFVVPNKEFITGRLLNWTLSDSVNRVVIRVGVAYGTDTEKARQLLLSVARQHPQVLEIPPPSATFDEFGDSALNFTLRAFLASLDCRLEVIHELNTSIHRAFAEAGIEIPFPQRELHIRAAALPLSMGAAPQDAGEAASPSARAKGSREATSRPSAA